MYECNDIHTLHCRKLLTDISDTRLLNDLRINHCGFFTIFVVEHSLGGKFHVYVTQRNVLLEIVQVHKNVDY